MYRFIDLFCGIGGFRVALERQGMECVFSSDIDKKVQAAYESNFGDVPFGDITEIHERKIPKHDILCAGFPCQPFSQSGKQRGIKDDRGRLFYEIVRIAEYHQPYVLLLENVKNIISIDNGGMIKTIEKKLNEIGYDVHLDLLNASYFGIPQARERVYFVCLKKGEGLNYRKPKEIYKKIYLKNILLSDEVCNDLVINRNDIVVDYEEKENELKPIRIGHVNKAHQGERIYSIQGHSVTIAATTGGAGANTGLYLVNNNIRRLHINECKKLMGFSTSHKVCNGREGYKQIGNAVIPIMIDHVYDSIRVA